MGDRIGVQLLVWKIFLGLINQPSQLSLAILRWVGAMSTSQKDGNVLWLGVKACMARV